jgi:hypothetical protein
MSHPTDPAHMARWLRTPRASTRPVHYAAAVERPAPKGVTVRCVLLSVAIGVVFAVTLFIDLGA